MSTFFDKLKPRRSVLKRTKVRPDLPKLLLYTDWLPGKHQRRLLDIEGNPHELDDNIVESYYKLSKGSESTKLIDDHWPDQKPKPVKK